VASPLTLAASQPPLVLGQPPVVSVVMKKLRIGSGADVNGLANPINSASPVLGAEAKNELSEGAAAGIVVKTSGDAARIVVGPVAVISTASRVGTLASNVKVPVSVTVPAGDGEENVAVAPDGGVNV
jgi:hypothetical protein